MRALFISFLLFLIACAGQNQKQTTDYKYQTEQSADQKQVKPPVQQITSPTAQPDSQREKEAAKPESKPWLSHSELVMAILTGIYVLLTALYVLISLLTLNAIKRQAKLTEDQGESNAEQFKKQLSTMEAQVAALTKTAEATDKSANAAKASADALINIERAWIFLDIALSGQLVPINIPGMPNVQQTEGNFSYRCRNVGKSPAWIDEKILHFEIYDSGPPKRPEIDSLGRFEYGPEPMEVGGDKTSTPSWDTEGVPGPGKFTLVLGAVKYRDIFGVHVTVCGYMLSPDQKRLERMAGPDYNQYT